MLVGWVQPASHLGRALAREFHHDGEFDMAEANEQKAFTNAAHAVLEALESTDEQKALRADFERLNKLQDLFIKGDEFHIVMCAGENDDEECEHDAHPHFEAFDWSWRCEAVRSNTLRDVIDQAIDKARHD